MSPNVLIACYKHCSVASSKLSLCLYTSHGRDVKTQRETHALRRAEEVPGQAAVNGGPLVAGRLEGPDHQLRMPPVIHTLAGSGSQIVCCDCLAHSHCHVPIVA